MGWRAPQCGWGPEEIACRAGMLVTEGGKSVCPGLKCDSNATVVFES